MAHSQHQAEAHQKRIGGAPFIAVMGFGDHFVADDIEHGAPCKGKGKGQHRRGDTHREIKKQTQIQKRDERIADVYISEEIQSKPRVKDLSAWLEEDDEL